MLRFVKASQQRFNYIIFVKLTYKSIIMSFCHSFILSLIIKAKIIYKRECREITKTLPKLFLQHSF